jgi:vacuolar-type H+-ATPase subunit H
VTENQTGGTRTAVRDEGSAVTQHAKEAADRVGSTVADQAAEVKRETADQARHVVRDVRERVAAEAEQQARRVSQQLGRIADELGEMARGAPSDSMSAGAIRSAADTSRQAARFLDERGAQGLLDSARDYARRKPGTFLLGAAVAGFLVGRVAKSATAGEQSRPQGGGTVPVASERPDVTPEYGAPLTPSASPAVPAAGVPHVEP